MTLIFGFLAGIFALMRSSEPYRVAVETTRASPRAKASLGEPIEPGWIVTGSIKSAGASGRADLVIPVTGSAKNGRVRVVALRSADGWQFTALVLDIDGGDKIDLRSELPRPNAY